jgi:hypothetical protein
MASGQKSKLDTSGVKEGIVTNTQRVGPPQKHCKGRVNLSVGAGANDLESKSHGECCWLNLS